jgi:hypothetical protein
VRSADRPSSEAPVPLPGRRRRPFAVELTDRVAAIGGHFDIHSPPGGGTRLHAQMPLTAT